jgi:hypothetical protein
MSKRAPRQSVEKRLVVADGEPMKVYRPANPQRSLELFAEVQKGLLKDPSRKKELWAELHGKLEAECGPYKFVGFATAPKAKRDPVGLVNEEGDEVGLMQPGDTFFAGGIPTK